LKNSRGKQQCVTMGRSKVRIPDYSAEPFEIKISAGDWKCIEKAYGQRLCSDFRQGIIEVTRLWAVWVAASTNTPQIDKVRSRIQRIQKRGRALNEAFRGEPRNEACSYGDECIESSFHPDCIPKSINRVCVLIELIKSLDVACTDAVERLDKTEKTIPTDRSRWDWWVVMLGRHLGDNGLPIRVRKDSDKQKSDVPSPFVALIRELQKLLPKEYRRSGHSNNALAQAIVRARNRKPCAGQ
jgi:hypothetical protein